MKPCTNGPRHKWSFIKNTAQSSSSGNMIKFALKGLYRCECGQRKLGAAGHDGADLRELLVELKP